MGRSHVILLHLQLSYGLITLLYRWVSHVSVDVGVLVVLLPVVAVYVLFMSVMTRLPGDPEVI